MLVETLSDEFLEGWTKLGVFALILAFVLGLVFLLVKASAWREKSGIHKRGRIGIKSQAVPDGCMLTGWYYADPLISAGIGLFILPRTWILLRDAVGVLVEGTPTDVNLAALREAIGSVTGVANVHDLHVWSLTSGVNAMSVHVSLSTPRRIALARSSLSLN